MLVNYKTSGKALESMFAHVWFAHFQINGVSPACTRPVVTQRQDACSLRLLGVQERNPLDAASGAFQPIQLQLRSEVCTGGTRQRWIWMERCEENMTMNSSQSATPSPLNPNCPAFMSVIFHYLWSKETFVGVLLHGASLDSGNNVLDTSTVCLPTLFLFPPSLPRLFSILIGVAEPQFHSRKL